MDIFSSTHSTAVFTLFDACGILYFIRDHFFPVVSKTLDRLTFFVFKDIRSEAAFIANIGGILPILLLDNILQVVIHFSTNAHGLFEGAGANGKDHELLHGQLVTSMRATVDNIEGL